MLAARAEAEAAFGNPEIYIEKYIERPRHVEFQILADQHGHIVHLGDRDCTVQRRHQKLIEESPSPALDSKLRRKMGDAAIKAAKATGYVNAGTIEFLLDEEDNFYFIEVNARIQVEHPVTEQVTGIDLIKEQIRICYGEKLTFNQDQVKPRGWAIECRINAEDPLHDFLPSPFEITAYQPPDGFGVRVDSGVYAGFTLPFQYDSLIVKLLAWGGSRDKAISSMRQALDEFIIDGIKTNIPFHKVALDDEIFQRGDYTTNFIEEREIIKKLQQLPGNATG